MNIDMIRAAAQRIPNTRVLPVGQHPDLPGQTGGPVLRH